MPLPLLLIGAAALVGGTGVVAGVVAKEDFDKAKGLNRRAQQIYDDAQKSLEAQRDRTQKDMERLGFQKAHLHQHGLKPFVAAFEKIKNVEYAGLTGFDVLSGIEVDILDLQKTVTQMEEVVSGAAAALGSGALTGLAAYGSVGLLGTASTGTAIAGLSGAAATNATLAWLGGGSLAAGGMGMAGGAAVLGGIVAAPVLLVGGFMLASKAEEAVAAARSNLRKAETAEEAMQTAAVAARAISRKANEVRKVLHGLQTNHLDTDLVALKKLVSANDDYRTYDQKQRHLVARTVAVAKTAHSVTEAPLLDKDGTVTAEIRKALREANKFLKTLNAM